MTKKALVLGGTRFFGKQLVYTLLEQGIAVTIATRGKTADPFGEQVKRLVFDRTSESSIKEVLTKETYDIVFDNIAYSAHDVAHLLQHVTPKRYVVTSSISVYPVLQPNLQESDFKPEAYDIRLAESNQLPYGEGKQTVESILTKTYPDLSAVFVRFPYVVGQEDYTQRFAFYLDKLVQQEPMAIDNLTHQMAFVDAEEAGRFLAFLGTSDFTGPINGASKGTISIEEIFAYATAKTGKVPLFAENGVKGPYNGTPDYSINTTQADAIGFVFSDLKEWLYQLCDWEIDRAAQK